MRTANLIALLVFGSLWAGLLVVGGALLAASAERMIYAALLSGGAAGIAAGGFVFQVVVADRLFPRVDRRVADVAEASLAGLLIIALGLTALLLTGDAA